MSVGIETVVVAPASGGLATRLPRGFGGCFINTILFISNVISLLFPAKLLTKTKRINGLITANVLFCIRNRQIMFCCFCFNKNVNVLHDSFDVGF